MTTTYVIQPAAFTDNLTASGHVGTRLPYPFPVDTKGNVLNQDFWHGTPKRVIGFQNDLAVQRVDLWFGDWDGTPEAVIGKYLVLGDEGGAMWNPVTAVSKVTVVENQEAS